MILYSLNSDEKFPQSDEESEDTDFTSSEFLTKIYIKSFFYVINLLNRCFKISICTVITLCVEFS